MQPFMTLLAYPLALALLWWALTGGASSSWLIGIPVIVSAAVLAMRLAGHRGLPRLSALGVIRFVPFFFIRCLTAGLDVARRALSRQMLLEPALVDYRTSLPAGSAQVAMVNVLSLLPGTLAADLEQDRLRVHVLDKGQNFQREIYEVERAVARIFRAPSPKSGAEA